MKSKGILFERATKKKLHRACYTDDTKTCSWFILGEINGTKKEVPVGSAFPGLERVTKSFGDNSTRNNKCTSHIFILKLQGRLLVRLRELSKVPPFIGDTTYQV